MARIAHAYNICCKAGWTHTNKKIRDCRMNKIVRINTELISNWDSFHQIFKMTFGFPEFYGNNMNAWIDCMSYIDDKETGMTKIFLPL